MLSNAVNKNEIIDFQESIKKYNYKCVGLFAFKKRCFVLKYDKLNKSELIMKLNNLNLENNTK